MVLNSIFLYSHDGHTLVFRDYNPGESTVDISRTFVSKYLASCLKLNHKLRMSTATDYNLADQEDQITEKHSMTGIPVVEIVGTDYYAVYLIRQEVVYTAFTNSDTHLLVVVEYLKVLADTLEESIKTDLLHEIPKNSRVHFILDLLLDYSVPVLPSKNFLISMMKKNSYQKIMDKAVEEVRTNDDAFWHPHLQGITSFDEECLFDHDEIFTGIIDENGVVLASEIMGKVDVDNKSSEVHSIQFSLKHPQKIESYSLHKWAKGNRKRFAKDGVVSFTPGLNKFTVAKYICNPLQWALPFELTPTMKLNEEAKIFKVKIVLKSAQVAGVYLKVTDFEAKVHFSKLLTSSSVTAVDEKSEFLLNDQENIGVWKIGNLKADLEYEIGGSFRLPSNFVADNEEVDVSINFNFDIQSYIISGAHVESIKMRDMANPVDVVRGLKSTTHVQNLEMRITVRD